MNLISGRSKSNSAMLIEGDIRLNNVPLDKVDMSRISSYVKQESLLLPDLRVAEAVKFSATLSCTGTDQEKITLSQKIISELGLEKCASTLIGGSFQKGVSGGEKKRTAIAVDLVSDPQILFLDEPTTGLDSFSAEKVVESVSRLQAEGRTVIMTIHQPNSRILSILDRLILIVDGGIV